MGYTDQSVEHDSISDSKKQVDLATQLFCCSRKDVKQFEHGDPFNANIILSGWKCMKEAGGMGGSLLLTRVDGTLLKKSQLIYSTPKLQYPYSEQSWKKKKELAAPDYSPEKFPQDATHYLLERKWNGTNILFFKYRDHANKVRVSAKTKGSATVSNSQYNDFLDLVYQSLGLPVGTELTVENTGSSGALLETLWNDNRVQAQSFELCGRLEPHLVNYSFDIALKPLFCILYDAGNLVPWCTMNSTSIVGDDGATDDGAECQRETVGPFAFDREQLIERCRRLQLECQQLNEQYRADHNLKHAYEYDRFISEGFVLYVVKAAGDSNFCVVTPHRTLYKIKPRDVEEVHWAQFDDAKKGQVRDALRKMRERDRPFDEATLREELDMGTKEWNKFGGHVMKYIRSENLVHRIMVWSKNDGSDKAGEEDVGAEEEMAQKTKHKHKNKRPGKKHR